MNYGDNKSIQAIKVFKFNSKMICVMARQLVDSPNGLQSFNTKLLAWGLHSDHLCSMNLEYKLPQRLANHTFSEPVSFPLTLKCPLICLIDLLGGGLKLCLFLSKSKKKKKPTWKHLSLMSFNKRPQIIVGTGVHKAFYISGITW